MANEDLLAQQFAEIYAKANPDAPSDNQQLNKIEVPNDEYDIGVTSQTYTGGTNLQQNINDSYSVGTSASTSTIDPSTFRWGGIDSGGVLQYGGWDWGIGGAWG